MSLEIGKTKVLVRSYYREPTVKTWEDAVRNPKTNEIEHQALFRPFHEHECWMTPGEADFLVNSEENRMHTDQGFIPLYTFPMGQAVPVPADFANHKLTAPLTEAGLATTDARQADAARRKMDAAKRALEAGEKAKAAAEKEPATAGATE